MATDTWSYVGGIPMRCRYKAGRVLGWMPRVRLEDGIADLTIRRAYGWLTRRQNRAGRSDTDVG